MHLSALEDGRQLVLLDLHTKRQRSAPTKEIRKRLFAAIKHTQAGDEYTKKTALKKTQGCSQNIPVRVLECILPQRHRAAASYRLQVPILERSY